MADLTANRITNDVDIIKTQIQQKTDDGMKAIRPETDTDIVINNSTNVTGNTVTDAFNSALPIIAGQNISITPSASGVTIGFTGSLAPNVEVKGTAPITVSPSVTDTAAKYTVGVNNASTSAKGVVQLSDSTSSDSAATAATSKAVKAAYDLAKEKQKAFADGSATIATANGGKITIKAGVSQSGGTIKNSSDSDISTYTAAQIDSLVAGLTKYLGTATKYTDLTSASTANAGDFFRVTTQFSSSNWGTAHVGDIVILKKDAVAGDYASLANWEIIHTGDNTSYGIVNKTTDGLTPKWDTYDGTKVASANYVLMNDGTNVKWRQLPDTAFSDHNTTYTLSSGDTGNAVKLTSSSGNAQTVTINDVAHAISADHVAYPLIIKLNDGTTEGSNKFVYDGAAAKSVNITASGIGAAASSHDHGNITSDGKISSINDTPITSNSKIIITDDSGQIARSSITFDGNTTNKALAPNGRWTYFAQYINSGVQADGTTDIISTALTNGIMTLGDSGVTPGVYCALQVNSKGIVTAGAHVIKIYENGTTIGSELVTGGFAFIKI